MNRCVVLKIEVWERTQKTSHFQAKKCGNVKKEVWKRNKKLDIFSNYTIIQGATQEIACHLFIYVTSGAI